MSDKFVVHKFGGTSVGNAECFAKVSDIVAAVDAPRIAVVVSAIGGKPKVTDLLIGLLTLAKERKTEDIERILETIRQKHRQVIAALLPTDVGQAIEDAIESDIKRLSELLRAISIMRSYNENVVEFISGHGEIWSAKILSEVLSLRAAVDGKKHKYKFIDARDFLIVEPDEDHGPVVQYDLTMRNIQKIIKNEGGDELTHVVITGFICSTTEGVMTTLKRDGSDFTASICGRVLKASSITIWTDVSGVLSSDPRRVPESKILSEVSYEEAMELAYFGAKVIHPKTMTPAVLECIPIYIRNTFEPEHPGTKIFHRKRVELQRSLSNGLPTAKNIVSGFSTVDNLALFNIEGSGMVGVHGTSSRLFSALDRIKVNVVLIAQASSEHSICFAVPMSRADDVKAVVDETFFKEIHHGLIEKTDFMAPISIIAAVGDNMSQTPGVCSRFFGALGHAKINVMAISQGSSERNISAVVRYEDSAAALRAVHSAFFLSDQTISIGVVGLELEDKSGIGHALLEQYNQQCAYLKARFNVDIRIRAIATHSSSQMLLDHNGGITSDALTARVTEFESFDHDRFLKHVCADHLPHWLIVDVSNSAHHVDSLYPTWLNRKVNLISSNLNVAASSATLHSQLRTQVWEKELTFDTEACLAVGVPIFSTLQNFIQTGDQIQRVEFSGSRVLNSILQAATSSSASLADIITDKVREFRATLSVRDVLDDVSGVRSGKKAILLARELGFACELQDVTIESSWRVDEDPHALDKWSDEQLLAFLLCKTSALETQIAESRAASQSLRLMAIVDAQTSAIRVHVASLPVDHAFATLAPLQCGFAFHTTRHATHPVVVSGPLADAAITASTLFGSILNFARNCGARDTGNRTTPQ
ncbi:hypothetical protein Poli38472_012247 [Pythium oligandrum]|uniref:ACT domain-containing protein n=1 Tax=Pythium oligandrum TaxID=41045 RepID=A0A8K1CNY3_PYTOL|nr:hypothetical protein Poli38472_012247 [Pythium oligandrum]|eukprot:TMW67131.1 hypothetical protein Poli38472_012247 [Pythium oligandrum]